MLFFKKSISLFSTLLIAVGLALVLPTAAQAAPTPSSPYVGLTSVSGNPNYVINIDCSPTSRASWNGEGPEIFPAPGDTVTITTSANCTTEGVTMKVTQRSASYPGTGGYTVSGVPGQFPNGGVQTVRSLVAMPNTTFEFIPASGNRLFINVMPLATLNPDPTGTLLSTNQITIPANNPTVATFTKFPLPSPARCSFDGNNQQHVYTTHAVSIPVAGDYSFRFVSTSPVNGGSGSSSTGTYWFGSNIQTGLGKPILLLYSSFDPSNPTVGLVGCNSGSLTYQETDNFLREVTSTGYILMKEYPLITASLSQGNYTLVMSTVNQTTVSAWNTAGFAQTGVVEQWGPTPPPAPPTPPTPELAETGLNANQQAATLVIGAIAVALGGLGLIVRRRLRNN
jgi:hypothetical protein